MKLYPLYFYFSFFLLQGYFCNALIIEHDCITEVTRYLEPHKKILVLLDIDNTIAAPPSDLGSDQWFNDLVLAICEQQGLEKKEAVQKGIELYHHIHTHIELRPVEAQTPAFIASLQKQNIPVLALTARTIIERTFQQLETITIDFRHTALSNKTFDLSLHHPAFYQQGIIFCGNNDKGTVLGAFLERISYQPDKIIYVDDKEGNLKAVEQALQSRGIEFVGIRYSRLDERVKNINSSAIQKELADFLQKYPFKATPALTGIQA